MSESFPDCCSCGACCISHWNDGYYAAMTKEEVQRLSRWRQEHHIHYEDDDPEKNFPALRTRKNKQGHAICVAFRGRVNGKCSCSIYANRPRVCRYFKPGSIECHYARDASEDTLCS